MAANRSVQKFGENISPSEGNFSPVKSTPVKKRLETQPGCVNYSHSSLISGSVSPAPHPSLQHPYFQQSSADLNKSRTAW